MGDRKIKGTMCRWSDFDVAVICWLLAHDPDELEFWKKTNF